MKQTPKTLQVFLPEGTPADINITLIETDTPPMYQINPTTNELIELRAKCFSDLGFREKEHLRHENF